MKDDKKASKSDEKKETEEEKPLDKPTDEGDFLAALLLKQSAAYLVCHACVCM